MVLSSGWFVAIANEVTTPEKLAGPDQAGESYPGWHAAPKTRRNRSGPIVSAKARLPYFATKRKLCDVDLNNEFQRL